MSSSTQKHQGKKGNTMKSRFKLCFVLLSNLLMARGQTNDVASDTSKLIALENAWNQAQLHHDAKALNDLVSDAFVYTDYDGTVMSKAQFLAELKDPDYRCNLLGKGLVPPLPARFYRGRRQHSVASQDSDSADGAVVTNNRLERNFAACAR